MKSTFKVCFLCIPLFFLIVSCVPNSEEGISQPIPSSSEVSLQSTSPEDIARAYIAARQAYNIEQAKPYLADDIQITEVGNLMSLENVASFLKYAEAVGLNWEIVSCEVKSEGNTSEVNCPITISSNVSKALDIDSVSGNTYNFVISNNKITSTDLKLNLGFWGPNVFNRLRGYLQQNHPESISKMFVNGDLVGISDEGIELWKVLSTEYIQSLKSQ